jgi:hypothetical protein
MNISLIFNNLEHYNFSVSRIQHLIYKKLITLPDHEFEVVTPSTLNIAMAENPANLKSLLSFTIVNKANNKAIIINLSDRLEPSLMKNHGFDEFDIVQIIGGMSVDRSFYKEHKERIDSIRVPLILPVDKVSEDEYLVNCTKPVNEKIKKALFIGNVYSGRTEIVDILKKHPLFDIRHYVREVGYPFSEYITEMQKYSICLSLNGNAEICFRDLEAMGAQIPILRSKFSNTYYPELIPDYHYIAGSEPCSNGFLRYDIPSSKIADQFIAKIESVIDNEEYLNNIALNGRQYYEKNGNINSIADNAIKLINLDLLK